MKRLNSFSLLTEGETATKNNDADWYIRLYEKENIK